MSRWGVTDVALVTGPGTAITTRPHEVAQLAVFRAPLRSDASTTTVPLVRAAMSLLRTRKRRRVGCSPTGTSDTTHPDSVRDSNNLLCARG